MTCNMTWHMWHIPWFVMTWNVTCQDMWYDLTCFMGYVKWHDRTWLVTWPDMTWHDTICDMTWIVKWHMKWHDRTKDITLHLKPHKIWQTWKSYCLHSTQYSLAKIDRAESESVAERLYFEFRALTNPSGETRPRWIRICGPMTLIRMPSSRAKAKISAGRPVNKPVQGNSTELNPNLRPRDSSSSSD